MVVDATTMYPLRASMKAFGGWNKWQYSDWKPVVVSSSLWLYSKSSIGPARYRFPIDSLHFF